MFPCPTPRTLSRFSIISASDHPLLAFSAREADGVIEIIINLKNPAFAVHTYVFPIHPRDLESPQFAWQLQRQLYDALHDYFVEMFTRTPQDRRIGDAKLMPE